jgi:glycosyltransferase involved in cell wall biosynthesis
MKRVLVLQYSIEPPGGGNGVAAWMIDALSGAHRVTLLTWRRPDLTAVDRFFGTTLAERTFACLVAPAALRRAFACSPLTLALLKDAYLMRRARQLAAAFDVVISASNEADLGPRGIQYVHYPRLDPERPAIDLRWYHRWPPLLRAYRAAALRITGFSPARMRRNLTLANSAWTADRLRAVHGIEALVVHPAVAAPWSAAQWAERADGFVCVGRLAPEKRLERVIDIVARVRARGHAVHLHLAGSADDAAYGAFIRRQVAAHAEWVSLEENLSRAALGALIIRHRYGIHAMEEEHFGMAVAEMVSAGCVVFAPAGGGQREILGGDERLLYRTPADAVLKITAVLTDPARQQALRDALAARASEFSPQRFAAIMRRLVDEFV